MIHLYLRICDILLYFTANRFHISNKINGWIKSYCFHLPAHYYWAWPHARFRILLVTPLAVRKRNCRRRLLMQKDAFWPIRIFGDWLWTDWYASGGNRSPMGWCNCSAKWRDGEYKCSAVYRSYLQRGVLHQSRQAWHKSNDIIGAIDSGFTVMIATTINGSNDYFVWLPKIIFQIIICI